MNDDKEMVTSKETSQDFSFQLLKKHHDYKYQINEQ